MEFHTRPGFIHHQKSSLLDSLREIVFGAEDGMVSTLGALTGIVAGTSNHFTVVLAGFVIVTVESISMAVGSYLSIKSSRDVDARKLYEESIELRENTDYERKELVAMFVRDGWPEKLAADMAQVASENKDLFLKEMAYRELYISPHEAESPLRGGIFMFISYLIGGSVPLVPYILLPIPIAFVTSVIVTLCGLFLLGALTTKFTKRSWWKSGLEMLGLASIAAIVGYTIGTVAERIVPR